MKLRSYIKDQNSVNFSLNFIMKGKEKAETSI